MLAIFRIIFFDLFESHWIDSIVFFSHETHYDRISVKNGLDEFEHRCALSTKVNYLLVQLIDLTVLSFKYLFWFPYYDFQLSTVNFWL